MVFTGNNIAARGDLASRALEARINPDRPDPKTAAMFTPTHVAGRSTTILMGNPQLLPDCKREEETRFKMWWRMVGSAVENAAELATGEIVSFQRMFESTGEQDEDAMARGELLQTLHDMFGASTAFTAAEVLAKLDESVRHAGAFSEPEKIKNIDGLRASCTPRAPRPSPSARCCRSSSMRPLRGQVA